jgi:predicted TIM-barrel fold metal-dependent hydrolase
MPNLIEWAVHEVGADRVLFGSDTPLYFVANQRARIDQADLSAADKRLILRLNAERLLGHPGRDRH